MRVVAAFEGDTDEPVVAKLLEEAGLELSTRIDCGGKGNLDADFDGYNEAAKGAPWFVLRDLDLDAPCAGGFLVKEKVRPARWMCFRIAVREVEAWLLADHAAFASFFAVSARDIPDSPDDETDPTRTLVNLARMSKRERIRKAMVPKKGRKTVVGELYESTIIEFAAKHWNPERASKRSPSLLRARRALAALARDWKTRLAGA